MDTETAKTVCHLIAGIVIADDDLDPAEEAFIERMLTKFGLPSSERDALFPIVEAEEAAAEIQKLSPSIQSEALACLVEAAAADGKIVDEERAYLQAVASAMGVDDTKLASMVDAALAS